MKGIVIKNENGYFSVKGEDHVVYLCKVRGRLKKERYRLLVGDLVIIERLPNHEGFIEEILERRNSLKRPYVANIDQVVLVVAAKEPDVNILLLNKLIIMIEDSDIPMVLCFNKWDLADEVVSSMASLYERIGYRVLRTSTYTGEGLEALRYELHHKLTCFAGPSGVGKSSLLNAVEPSFSFQTSAVSDKIKRGRHTTRHASLYSLDEDSYIMDTPGFSAIDFSHISKERLPSLFPEFAHYIHNCKFIPCSHTHEPICGIKAAVEENHIAQTRYDAYISILEEVKG